MKRLFSPMLILLLILALFATPALAAKGTIGYVVPYKVGYFSSFVSSFESVAKAEGYKTVQLHHEYNAANENKAVEDLITLGVDAIHVVSVSPASAEYSCRLANEAGIPIQVSDSGILEAQGKPFANIDFDWVELYGTVARNIRQEVSGDLEVLWIQGFLGTPPVIMGIDGFNKALTELKGIKLATDIQQGNYATAPSLDITKGIVQSGVKFNVAIGACQEITEGIIQGLKEEGVSLNDVTVVSVNGGPMDIANLKSGKIDYVLSHSPGIEGLACARNIANYLQGKPYAKKVMMPIKWVSQQTWEKDLIPWDVDASWLPVVDEYLTTGNFDPSLKN
jgi:ribose transport system substrate-binding protein